MKFWKIKSAGRNLSSENVLEGKETGEVNHLSKLGEIIDTLLNFLQAVANSVALNGNLEERVADGALEKKVVGHDVV